MVMDFNIIQDQFERMNLEQLTKHIVEITQTEICKNKKYCDILLKVYLKK